MDDTGRFGYTLSLFQLGTIIFEASTFVNCLISLCFDPLRMTAGPVADTDAIGELIRCHFKILELFSFFYKIESNHL